MKQALLTIPTTSYIGEYIHQVAETKPELIPAIVRDLRSQAKDDPKAMRNLIGDVAYEALTLPSLEQIELEEDLIKY